MIYHSRKKQNHLKQIQTHPDHKALGTYQQPLSLTKAWLEFFLLNPRP